jgi:hypothetical protein
MEKKPNNTDNPGLAAHSTNSYFLSLSNAASSDQQKEKKFWHGNN